MDSIKKYLKTEYAYLEPREVLQNPPRVLLGVTLQAQEQLKSLDIHSVFDLALSTIFSNASKLLQSNLDVTDTLTQYGAAPSDIVDNEVQVTDVAELPMMDIQVLAGIGPATGPLLSEALDVKTVRDLALWPPYLAARSIFQSVFNPEEVPGYDPEAPADLVPKSGVYPTERVFYKTIVLEEIEDDVDRLKPLENAGPIDILTSTNADFGFKKPGVGAILTYSQSWYTQGVTLGQLLHSVALAPGESTKIAMIDWSRRSGVSVDESIGETEALSNNTQHNRSISEVTNAVAVEAQSGFSGSTVESQSFEAGGAIGGFFSGILGGASLGAAGSSSTSSSFSTSTGRRNLSAEMSQNIMDSTQQFANASRNRRASVIKEVSQSESEKVSTRVVTNYNHMHAMSIQYYEMVQLYRVAVQLSEVEKCLFIPMKLINFEDESVIMGFRHSLAKAALTKRIQRLINSWLEPDHTLIQAPAIGKVIYGRPATWNENQVESINTLVGYNIIQPSNILQVPSEIKLIGITYISIATKLTSIQIDFRFGEKLVDTFIDDSSAAPANFGKRDFVEPIPLEDIATIQIGQDDTSNWGLGATVSLKLNYLENNFTLDVPLELIKDKSIRTLITFPGIPGAERELANHLMANRLHYNQAIWMNLDSSTLALLLSPYKYQGKPVTQMIDPDPITVAGNFLVFRMHADKDTDPAWAKWLKDHDIDKSAVKQEIVPLPSGGVFAEAVLGRYNSAEKLDMTRFWNWQDSPIPDKAPEIAPIATGSRNEPDNTKPGNFSQPLVNIVTPTSLPDPQGLGTILNAISNGNMFRDMSGLANTIGLAQAALNATNSGAGRAAQQAGTNMKNFGDFQLEMVKTILPFVAAAMGVPMMPSSGSKNISEEGAKINHGAKLDQKNTEKSESGGSAPSSEEGQPETQNGSSRGGTPSTNTSNPSGGSGSHELDAFNNSLGGSSGPGIPAARSLLESMIKTILAAAPDGSTESSVTLSGADWVKKYPQSKDLNDLDETFRSKVEKFIEALEDGGATVKIISTLRPSERAYLMHWSWKIAREDYDATKVPAKKGVPINWDHGDAEVSKAAAQAMVNSYGIDPDNKVAPAPNSNHTEGNAIDMNITWKGALKVKQEDGTEKTINASPKDSTNSDLIEVGKTYGVIHLEPAHKDPNHWSVDGK